MTLLIPLYCCQPASSSSCDPLTVALVTTRPLSAVGLFRDESGVEDGRRARPAHRGAISLRHRGHFDELPGRRLKSRRCRGDVCVESAAVDWS